MNYSSLVNRISPPADAEGDPWEVHNLARQRIHSGEDVVLLSIGQEADETTPSSIVDACIASLHGGDHHYTEVEGDPLLRNSIAKYHAKLTGQTVTSNQCVVYSGAQNGLYSVAQTLLEPGDSVIVSEPYYTTYAATFSTSGAEVICVPVLKEHGFQLQVDDIASAMQSNTRVIVLNSPNNPMGSVYSKEQFQAVVDLCVANKVWLVLDAVYLDIVDVDPSQLPHTIDGADEVLVTIGSLSKSHRMTGWRLGWVIGPEELAGHLAHLSMCMHYGLPPFIMKAAIAALEQAHTTPGIVKSILQRRRKIAQPVLASMQGATLIDSGQGMFMLIDVSNLGITAREFCIDLLNKYNVALLPCDGFGKAGKTLVRVGLCVDDSKLESACTKIVSCIAEYTSQTND